MSSSRVNNVFSASRPRVFERSPSRAETLVSRRVASRFEAAIPKPPACVRWRKVGKIEIGFGGKRARASESGHDARAGVRVGDANVGGARVDSLVSPSNVLSRLGGSRFARALPVAVLAALAAPTVAVVSSAFAKPRGDRAQSERNNLVGLLVNFADFIAGESFDAGGVRLSEAHRARAGELSGRFKALRSGGKAADVDVKAAFVDVLALLLRAGVPEDYSRAFVFNYTGVGKALLDASVDAAKQLIAQETAAAPLSVSVPAKAEVHTNVVLIVSRGGVPVVGENIEILTPSGLDLKRVSEANGQIVLSFASAGRCIIKFEGKEIASFEVVEPATPAPAERVPLPAPDPAAVARPEEKKVEPAEPAPVATPAGVVSTAGVPFVAGSVDVYGDVVVDPLGLTRFVDEGYRIKASLRPYAADADDAVSHHVVVAFDHASREVVITDDLTKADLVLSKRLVDRGKLGYELRVISLPVEAYLQFIGVYESVASRTEVNERTPSTHGFDLDFEAGLKVAEWLNAFVRASTDHEVGHVLRLEGAFPLSLADLLRLASLSEEGGRTRVGGEWTRKSFDNPADYQHYDSPVDAELAAELVQRLQADGVRVFVDSTLFEVGEGVGGKRLFSLSLSGGFDYSKREHGHTDAFRRLVELGGSFNLSDILSGRVVALVGNENKVIRFEGTSEREDSRLDLRGVQGSGVFDPRLLLDKTVVPPDAELRVVVSGSALPGGERSLTFTLEGRW